MSNGRHRPRAVALIVGLLAAVAILPVPTGWTSASTESESLAAWQKIAAVLQHPRCLNCHQLQSPLQGDARRPHIPQVVRGADNHGVSAMRCGNCHNEMGNNPTSGTPGAPHWQLAPASMLWQDLSVGDLCRMLKDPTRNGDRTPDALIEHMGTDALVLWGWNPGAARQPVPIAHDAFVDLLKVWIVGGAACPQ